ncbi:DUF6020 family protein [Bacillus sp. AK128]
MNRINITAWTSLFLAVPSSLSLIFFYYPIRNVSLLLIGLTLIVIWYFIYSMFKNNGDFSSSKWTNRTSVFFILLLSLWFLLATKNQQTHLLNNSNFVQIFTYIGAIFSIFVILYQLLYLILKTNINRSAHKPVNKLHIVYYALPITMVWFLYWIAFFPGGMTPDSFSHWDQINTGVYNDWHPFAYTIYMLLLTQIWDTPAIIGLSQIVTISFVIGYSLYRFQLAGINNRILWVVTALYALWPINGIYVITLWKDVYYAAFLLFFFMIIFNLVITKGKWITTTPNLLLALIASLGVVFFRHNGFPVYVVVMIVLLFSFRMQWKQLMIISSITISLHYIVSGPIFDVLNVTPSNPNEALGMPTQQIANIITYGVVTNEQEEYFNQILPIEKWVENYHPYLTDPIKFDPDYNSEVIMNDTATYFRMWLELCKQNPYLAIEAFLKQTSLVWQFVQPEDPGYTSTYVTNIYYGNKYNIENIVLNEALTTNLQRYLTISNTTLKPVIWRPAIYSFIILFFTFAAFIKRDWKFALPILPIVLNTGTVFLGLPAQDFRYLYSNSLITFLAILLPFVHYSQKEEKA